MFIAAKKEVPAMLAVILMALYTRLDAAAILDNRVRSGMIALLHETPGVRVASLAAEFEVDYKTALYHARVLERAGLVVIVRAGRCSTCYLTRGTTPEEGLS